MTTTTTTTAAPTTTTRLFGVELEGVRLTTRQAAEALIAAGVPTQWQGDTHNGTATSGDTWKVVYDGSVSGGFEAVSPPMTSLTKLAAVCTAIRNAGGRVDRRCGTHVHVDARDLTVSQVRRLCRLWERTQVAIEGVLAPSRRNGPWCYRNARTYGFETAQSVRQLAGTFGYGRYHALNLHAFARHGTVEFRGHQGTLDGGKLTMWVRLVVRMVEWAAAATDADVPTSDLDLEATLALLTGANAAAPTAAPTTRPSLPARRPRAGTKARAMWDLFDGLDPRVRTQRAFRSMAYDACERQGFRRHVARRTFAEWLAATATATAPVSACTAMPDAAAFTAFFRERAVALTAPARSRRW